MLWNLFVIFVRFVAMQDLSGCEKRQILFGQNAMRYAF